MTTSIAVGLHVEPGQVARLVLVGLQRPGAKLEVAAEPRVVGELGGFAELGGRAGHRGGVDLMVRRGHQPTGAVPAYHRVVPAQGPPGGGRSLGRPFELLGGQIRGIELGACGPRPRAGDERAVPVEAVPRPVVDLDEPPGGSVGHARQQGIAGMVVLLLVDGVHLRRSLDQEREHAALAVGQPGQVGREPDRGVLGHFARDGRARGVRRRGVGSSLAPLAPGATACQDTSHDSHRRPSSPRRHLCSDQWNHPGLT